MPFRLAEAVTLVAENPPASAERKTFAKGTLFERTRAEIQAAPRDRKLVEICRTEEGKKYTGLVDVRLLRPVYGQTKRLNGHLIEGTEKARDLCNQLSKALLALPWKSYAGDTRRSFMNTRRSFMIGVLLGENLDDRPVSYAALAVNKYVAPSGWEDKAKRLGLIPAPDLQKVQGHGGREAVLLRNVSGKRIEPIKPGKRSRERLGHNASTTDWDVPDGVNPAIDRIANEPGACAAPRMIQLAIRQAVTIRAMWEQWFDQQQGLLHQVPMESCPTCQVNITRMLKR